MKSPACLFVCVLFGSLMAHAQGVGTSGAITGTVTDASGAVLPRATVNVVDTQTGLKRTAETNNIGRFRATGLPPATYDVSADLGRRSVEASLWPLGRQSSPIFS